MKNESARHRISRYAPEPLESRTLLAAGALDSTFDDDGILTMPFHATISLHREVDEMVVLPDGRVVAAGGSFDVGEPQFAALARYNTDGSLDQTFGTGGKVLTPEFLEVNSLFALPGDQLLLIGAGFGLQPMVARYTSTGALDTAFDGDGVLRLALTPRVINATGGLQSDGKIILAGTVNLGQAADLYVARLNPDGTPDFTFGDPATGRPGFMILDLGFFEDVTDLVVADDDAILLLNSNVDGPLLTRLTADGVLDTTFGGGDGTVSTRIFRAEDQFGAIIVHAGKTLIAGFHYDPEVRDGYNVVARYNNDGSLDVTFDGDGRLIMPANSELGGLRIGDHLGTATDSEGNLLLAGAVRVGRSLWAAAVQRYKPDGSTDTAFGTAGTATVRLESQIPWAGAVALTPDARIVLGGGSFMDGADVFAVARLHADGRPDPVFGSDGDVTTTFTLHAQSTRAAANAAVQLPSGDLVVTTSFGAGTSRSDAGAIRLRPDGSLDPSFGDGGEAIVGVSPSMPEDTVHVERLADGRILVLTSRDLRRFSASGEVDMSFGSGGSAAFPIIVQNGGILVGTGMSVHADGSITVVGYLAWMDAPASRKYGFITRVNSDGTPDSSFVGVYATWLDSGSPYISDVLPIGDGRVVVASNNLSIYEPGYLRRYLRDGQLDTTFGPGGIGRVTVDDGVIQAQLQPDGKIITAGTVALTEARLDLSVRRFNADGSVDLSFGNGGRVVIDFGEIELASDIVLAPDGAIIIGGDDGTRGTHNRRVPNHFFLVRLTPSGQLDPNFGDDGVVKTPLPGLVQMNGLLRQADGKVVAFGTADRKIAVARFHMDEAPRVARVFVSGSAWTPAFRDAVAAVQGGSPGAGYAIPDARVAHVPERPPQFEPLPWTGLDTISVKFDRAASVDRDDLRVVGVNVANYPITGFSYNPSTEIATWTLGRTIGKDRIALVLGAGENGVHAGGTLLDGEWDEARLFPSGNGSPGGDFVYQFNVLPGDVDQDSSVLASDASAVKALFFRRPGGAGLSTGHRGIFHDLDGSGDILADDFSAVKARLFDVLPPAQRSVAERTVSPRAGTAALFESTEGESWCR